MKTTTTVSLLGLVAAALAAPLATGACDNAGALFCNGKGQFGICDTNKLAVWMQVAAGTECACSGTSCTIVASGSPAPAPAPAQDPTPVQNTPPAAESKPASQPATPAASQAPPASNNGVEPLIQQNPKPSVTPTQDQPSTASQGSGDASNTDYRKMFLGNGSPTEGWPQEDQWVSFESMWTENLKNVISKSCAGFGASPNNSPQESADLKDAIQSAAKTYNVDARYILAVVMQESNGCVRAPTTNYGVNNPGLMQSHNGAHTCAGVSPCPKDQIFGMIVDGVKGTSDGDGLMQLLAKAGGSGVQALYKAARMYNSGSIASSGLLQDGIATHCYVSDIANRLLGWSAGTTLCKI